MDSVPETSNNIYTGVWTDWSHGKFLGSTLTTTRSHGGLLIAFLSLFIAVVGTSFWRICCFVFHYIYSTEASRDAMYHQRQAILRNAANATTGIISLLAVFNAWRKSQPTKNSYQRILPLLAFSCLSLSAFAVASTFSSRLSTIAGHAVLLSSRNCGIISANTNSTNTTNLATVYQPYLAQLVASNVNYAQQCYPDLPRTEGCNTFVQRRLKTTFVRDAACPFPGDVCKSQTANFLLDTGLVDSHYGLGLNSPPSHRYQFRFVLQAAPLKSTGFVQEAESIDPGVCIPRIEYFYGPTTSDGGVLTNFTCGHVLSQNRSHATASRMRGAESVDLSIVSAQYMNGSLEQTSDWAPIKGIERTDADLHMAFLSLNSLRFAAKQSDDLWYPAHQYAGNITNSCDDPDDTVPMYFSDEAASPMGLVMQYQLCKPDLPVERRCTPLSSFLDAANAAQTLWHESEANDWFIQLLEGPENPLTRSIRLFGSQVLDSKPFVSAEFIGPLLENQWQVDVEKWANITLASIQQSFVDAATGPADPRQNVLLIKPEGQIQRQMCSNQKVLSTAYTNFSILGLAIILIVGGLIIIISYALEPFITWIQRKRNLDVYARLEWTMNETLQLQRLAHEGIGAGTWLRCDTDVPVTERLERLGVLDLSDRTHPKLMTPAPPFEELLAEESWKGSEQGGMGSGKGDAQRETWAEVEAEGYVSDSPGGSVSPAQP